MFNAKAGRPLADARDNKTRPSSTIAGYMFGKERQFLVGSELTEDGILSLRYGCNVRIESKWPHSGIVYSRSSLLAV
ncbi:hypothetical protein LSAT2_010063 [Lamellibrachia satsuma]|nr:hypothetical protein LSAT2_010063 [Lamellibrachia satsuma]